MLKENAATQKQIDDIDSQIAVLKKQLEAQISTLQRGNASITEESSAYEIQVAQLDDLGKDDRREYEGTITWISDKSEFTPKTIQTRDERANLVYATKIAVKNDGYIKIGMYGEMKK